MAKKIQVSFSDKQAELLCSLRGELGETDAEIVRNIVISWLSEKSFISTVIKQRLTNDKD
ncbi:CopG family transcriptional regulator [Rodentibacter trehalosifermentans]|uniref:CopG family transcriptional regulator n=1 Tax=Rodentibacter trehalosifermentans TaxID=1908263 RepID=A0A1V3IPF3_9PAST|nr:CopG family transcriptional regulator [Rodentibacter trehalosifermentans]OOF44073.1 CopG family transcriptional regulator [Rodentibacter trehalosifermentans]